MSVDRLVFSSPGASAGTAEAIRFARWFDEYRATLGGREIIVDQSAPFAASVEYLALGGFGLGRSTGSTIRLERRREHIAGDGDDRFLLVLNRSPAASEGSSRSRSAMVMPRSAILFDFAEPNLHVYPGGYNSITLHIPRRLLLAALPNAEDLAGSTIGAGSEALRLLAAYADCLVDDQQLTEPAILARAGQGLMDLAVLALGAERDNAEIARLRGVRAARLAAVLRRIRADYTDPDLSPAAVARRVGISTRYLHGLLQETGSSFSERVLELRLAKAFASLREGGAACRVSDAAYGAGFNDLSQFNRGFRRRYGVTPRLARLRPDGDP